MNTLDPERNDHDAITNANWLRSSDLAAVCALGIPGLLVRTGWGEHSLPEKQAERMASVVLFLQACRRGRNVH